MLCNSSFISIVTTLFTEIYIKYTYLLIISTEQLQKAILHPKKEIHLKNTHTSALYFEYKTKMVRFCITASYYLSVDDSQESDGNALQLLVVVTG